MCGIFGVLEHDPNAIPDRSLLEQSARLLAHRGPDHTGFYCEPGVALAHTRLSLVDLSARSNQPFRDPSGRYALIYNGEIFNFKKMRTRLEQQGVRFRTSSDTEVLLESILCDGLESTVARLEGMYAFAIYDSRERSLHLARDRFGIKPLFYFEDSRAFMFASEIRAFLPWREHQLDTLRAAGYLIELGSFTRGFTLLKGVLSVEPGTIVSVLPRTAARNSRFFALGDLWDENLREELNGLATDAVVDRVEAALLDAVDMQQFADASVGALCSGGLDSSVTVAMASRFQSGIQVFHAHGLGKDSELEYARAIASHLKLDLRSVDVGEQDHIDLMAETIQHRGSPFVDLPTSVPFLKLARLVRQHGVKGVLTGEGSDEIFWGFARMIPNLRRAAKSLPGGLYRLAGRAARSLAGRAGPAAKGRRKNLVYTLFSRFESDLIVRETQRAVHAASNGRARRRDLQSLLELGYNLPPLLNRNDGCGMAASIESRFPYLDYRLVKLAVNLPARHKARFHPGSLHPQHPFMIDKWILRKVADRYMPRRLSRRHKLPWPSSVHDRLQIERKFFERSFVRDLFGFPDRELDYLMQQADRILLLKLVHLEVWAQMFINGLPAGQVGDSLRRHLTIGSR